ncbi:XLF-domain-containing protein [Daldinia caldariorum]|uniref:XLF-domain-containing protein n=1 Tax=Daldinia caldariorum TaxID=326644 RepID=UPI002007E4C2|nr:XLF-domain-containing protein [Daldinia caldariorum]KAI1464169.1 XLF-domain-containing protein [Daldinia caldariorum]
MASAPKWHPLPIFPHLPALMISLQYTSSSYTLHVTDLANVWVESLDRKGIILRSLQENTSIDLSDGDPNQWTVFFSKLDAAFDPASPDHHTTSLSLSASTVGTTSGGGLALYVTCVLSEPLNPLKWPVYLTKCPPVGLASELVLPLIQAHHARTLEVRDLITRLKEKDAVITKLVDKLEANKVGLEHVFNSLSTKRKQSRATVEEKVKGLAPFNESDWRSSVTTSRELPRDLPSLIQEVFAETGLHSSVNGDISPSSQLNDWWTKLGSKPTTATKPPPKEATRQLRETTPPDTRTTEGRDDDDFQVQATPPHLQSIRRKYDYSKATGDTTDDDDSPVAIPDSHPTVARDNLRSRIGSVGGKKLANDNSASQSSRTVPIDDDETPSESDAEPVLPEPPKRNNARIGTIGKSREPSSPPKASSVPPSSLPPQPPKDGDETASGSDPEDDAGPSKARSSSPVPTERKRVGLGRIGGKPKTRVTPEPPEEPNVTSPRIRSPQAATSPGRPASRRIGTIGTRADADGKRYRPSSPVPAPEPETEEQRAERRRAELAKELERKAAAPTKKKRKF